MLISIEVWSSTFVVKSNLTGYDITCEEWYGSGKVPAYLDKSSWISDFLVRTLVIEGDFSNYEQLSIDPIYGDYFTNKGLKASITDAFGNVANGLDKFIQLPEVTTVAEYTGSLLPEFQDKDGTNLFIEDIINNETIYYASSSTEKKYVPNFLIEKDLKVNDVKILLNGLKLVGDYLDKTILKPNNLNYPNSRLLFINSFK